MDLDARRIGSAGGQVRWRHLEAARSRSLWADDGASFFALQTLAMHERGKGPWANEPPGAPWPNLYRRSKAPGAKSPRRCPEHAGDWVVGPSWLAVLVEMRDYLMIR